MSTSGILEHLDLMEPRLTSIIACSIFNSPAHRRSTDGTVVLVYLSENSCITSALSSPCAAACVSVTPGAKGVGACYLLKQSCHCWAAIYIECFWSKADVSIESTKLTLELIILLKRTSAKIQDSTFFECALFNSVLLSKMMHHRFRPAIFYKRLPRTH